MKVFSGINNFVFLEITNLKLFKKIKFLILSLIVDCDFL